MTEHDDLEPELASLLEVERAAPDLTAARKSAIAAKLTVALDLPPDPGGPAGPAPTLPHAAAPLAGGAIAKAVLLLIAGGVVGAFVHAQVSPQVTIVTPTPTATPTPTPTPTPTSTADAASPHISTSTLADERALVERGRAALARRDATSALEALREHARKFPTGQLGEERDALVVQALAVSGHGDDARRKASDFERKYPQSVFWPRIEETLRQIP